MSPQTRSGFKRCFAVAVRDGSDLFLFLSVCRAQSGDVYVNFPRDYKPNWKPHSSYHASGQHHQKSYGHKVLVRKGQKPGSTFSGTQNVVTSGIAADEPRAIHCPCQAAGFEGVFEIPISDLSTDMYRTMISVDISEPNGQPTTTPGSTVVRQAVFKDAVPWIIVTLFDTGSNQTVGSKEDIRRGR
jgi:hypothetical protein